MSLVVKLIGTWFLDSELSTCYIGLMTTYNDRFAIFPTGSSPSLLTCVTGGQMEVGSKTNQGV